MDDTPTTLLVAERDESQCEFLVEQFLADRFSAHGARSAEEARVKLANFHPDLLVVGELEGPHDQLGLLRAVRSGGDESLLVIVASPDSSELAELRAFRERCDDYLRKPVSYALLLARVRAVIRRSNGRLIPRRRIGALEIDQVQRVVTVAERPVRLSRMEFELLSHLAVEPTPRVQQGRAAAEGLAVQGSRKHAHGRRARLPSPQEARAGGRAAPDRQCACGRLSALCRAGRGRARDGGRLAVGQRPCGVAGGFGGGSAFADRGG